MIFFRSISDLISKTCCCSFFLDNCPTIFNGVKIWAVGGGGAREGVNSVLSFPSLGDVSRMHRCPIILPPAGKCRAITGHKFSSSVSKYFSASILPSTKESVPIPYQVMQPHTITLKRDLTELFFCRKGPVCSHLLSFSTHKHGNCPPL